MSQPRFAQTDVQLKRRYDLVPNLVTVNAPAAGWNEDDTVIYGRTMLPLPQDARAPTPL